ncbi:hypothetical protein [Parendozoicomonas sp. Alg238-R29]|uniref:hypothetical protein n=1 Tax=Parendozoicomonas sp. Alg238-R29 TaxID=2993446 RepID=UPI00248D88F5|nr:hypothetical protein [Parendozoicomonas sp. Alg238-R29]
MKSEVLTLMSKTCSLTTWLFLFITLSVHAEQTCHPMSVNTCTLPFPSNFYTQSYSGSATGLRVDLKGTLFSQGVEDAINNLSSPQIFQGATGFSAAAPVMIELPDDFDESSLPNDGGQTVLVINKNTGQRHPIRTQRFQYSMAERFSDKAHIIEIYPRSRFEYGHSYIAVVTNKLLKIDGHPFESHPSIKKLTNGTADWDSAQSMRNSLESLSALGISEENVITFVDFSIGDERTNNDPLFSLMDQVANDFHPVRNLKVHRINIWPYSSAVKGQIRLSDLRRETDGTVPFHEITESKTYWTDFILMLPAASKHGSAPVSIYGHGLGVTKESMLVTVAYPNAEKGIATIVIDQPYHGSRSEQDGGNLRGLMTPETLTQVSGMVTQSSLDMMSVLTALKTSLANLDVVPRKSNVWNSIWFPGGINTPDIDSNRIVYQGTSMGGALGTSFVATSTGLEDAFLQVTGVGLANILSHSTLFESFGFENLIPDSATAGESALFIHAIQQQVDHGDAINFAHYIRNPIYGREPKGLVVQYGMGDEIVFNRSTEVLAELAELPLITPAINDVPHLPQSPDYDNGYGLVQSKPLIPTGGLLDDSLAHASFIRIDSIKAMKRWIDDFKNREN